MFARRAQCTAFPWFCMPPPPPPVHVAQRASHETVQEHGTLLSGSSRTAIHRADCESSSLLLSLTRVAFAYRLPRAQPMGGTVSCLGRTNTNTNYKYKRYLWHIDTCVWTAIRHMQSHMRHVTAGEQVRARGLSHMTLAGIPDSRSCMGGAFAATARDVTPADPRKKKIGVQHQRLPADIAAAAIMSAPTCRRCGNA